MSAPSSPRLTAELVEVAGREIDAQSPHSHYPAVVDAKGHDPEGSGVRLLVGCLAVIAIIVGCTGETPPSPSSSPRPAASVTSPVASRFDAPTAAGVPFDSPLLVDPASLTGICSPVPADSDGAIPCEEAFREAIRAAGPLSAHVYRLEFAYGAPCAESADCPPPSPNVGYVILKSTEETTVVMMGRADDGRVQARPPQPTTLDLFRSGSFTVPPVARPSLPGDPSPDLADRAPLPFCGQAQMRRAAPSSAELCFRDAVLAGRAAELLAIGSSVEGADLVRVLRYFGKGAITRDVYQSRNALGEPGEWQHATTALHLEPNGGIEL